MSPARRLAWVHLVYGLVAVLFGGLGGISMVLVTLHSHGCSGMASALAGVLLIALAVCGLPQAIVGLRFVRGAPRAGRALAWLSIVNLVLNLATMALFASSGVAIAGVALLPAIGVNVLTLMALRRESAQPSS
jgi:hypothetical protein